MAYQQRGICRAKLDEFEEAIEDYTNCLELDANRPSLFLRRAELYFKLGKYEQAIADCRKAEEHAPENWKVHCQLAMIYGTSADAAIRDREKAVLEAEQAKSLSQGAWEALFALDRFRVVVKRLLGLAA